MRGALRNQYAVENPQRNRWGAQSLGRATAGARNRWGEQPLGRATAGGEPLGRQSLGAATAGALGGRVEREGIRDEWT